MQYIYDSFEKTVDVNISFICEYIKDKLNNFFALDVFQFL